MLLHRFTTDCFGVRHWRTYLTTHWVAPVTAVAILGCGGYAGMKLPELMFPPAAHEVVGTDRLPAADYGGPVGAWMPPSPFVYGGYQPMPGDFVAIPRGPNRPMPISASPTKMPAPTVAIDALPRLTETINEPVAIPEPGSWVLMLAALVVLAGALYVIRHPRIEDDEPVHGIAFGLGITLSTTLLLLAFV